MRGSKQMAVKTESKDESWQGKRQSSREDLRLLDVSIWAIMVYNGP